MSKSLVVDPSCFGLSLDMLATDSPIASAELCKGFLPEIDWCHVNVQAFLFFLVVVVLGAVILQTSTTRKFCVVCCARDVNDFWSLIFDGELVSRDGSQYDDHRPSTANQFKPPRTWTYWATYIFAKKDTESLQCQAHDYDGVQISFDYPSI
jgi:hypothetical protein